MPPRTSKRRTTTTAMDADAPTRSPSASVSPKPRSRRSRVPSEAAPLTKRRKSTAPKKAKSVEEEEETAYPLPTSSLSPPRGFSRFSSADLTLPSPVAIPPTPVTVRGRGIKANRGGQEGTTTAPAPAAAAAPFDLSRAALSSITLARAEGRLQFTEGGDQYITDIHAKVLYQPHTISAFILTIAILLYFTWTTGDQYSLREHQQIAAGMCGVFILLLGLLVFPSGPFIRPHPLVWRLAFGVGVVYELVLIFLLFQTKAAAREALTFFDPSLNQPVKDRSYAEDCTFTYEAVINNIDRFVVSHFVGWIIKALMIRDSLICWIISIQWEFIEIGLTHWLPNFAECAYDQWLLDVLLSNGFGIYVGGKLCEYLEMKDYKWTGVNDIPTLVGKVQRGVLQFTPASWIKVRWESTSTLSRFLTVNLLVLLFHLTELNAFMLKHLLWVPPESSLNIYRLAVWAFIGVPCLRQIYAYLTDPTCKRIGTQTFLGLCIISTELLIICKFGVNEFNNPMPPSIRAGWLTFAALYVVFVLVMCLRISRKNKSSESASDIDNDRSTAQH